MRKVALLIIGIAVITLLATLLFVFKGPGFEFNFSKDSVGHGASGAPLHVDDMVIRYESIKNDVSGDAKNESVKLKLMISAAARDAVAAARAAIRNNDAVGAARALETLKKFRDGLDPDVARDIESARSTLVEIAGGK